jgi:predicted DsbA family dithiol-disulfide isomerase
MHRIRFYYDIVCPYSYMESRTIEQAEDAGQVEVEWLPFELRPAPRPLLEPRGDHLRIDWTQHVYRRALSLGIEIHLPRYQPRSTLVLAACNGQATRASCVRSSTRSTRAFFCEARTCDRPGIRRAAGRVDLDPDAAIAALICRSE